MRTRRRFELVSYGAPRSSTVRIVDPETRIENPAGKVGEIWVHGDNVAMGYWRNPQQTERTFGAQLVDPSPGTPEGPWLRTGDLGVMSDGELFIIGRIKDLLIVDGRNHYPDDIEATIQEITGGRVAAISIPDDRSEQLVAIVELKKRGGSEEALDRLRTVKREVASAIRSRTACGWRIWSWCRRARFRSRPAARCGVRPASSGTDRTSSAVWTSLHDRGF